MDEAFKAAVIAGREQMELTLKKRFALSEIEPDFKATDDAEVAYGEAVDSMHNLLKKRPKA